MKKSRALRNWAIVAIVALVLCLASFIVGTILSAKIATRGFVWVPAFGGYLAALLNILSVELWSFSGDYMLYSIIFVALVVLVVAFFCVLLVVGISKKKKGVIAASFFELIFGLFLLYFFMLFFTGNFNGGTFDKAVLNDIIATFSFKTFNLGTVLTIALCVFLLTFVIAYVGIFVAALVKANKEEAIEFEEEPVAEEAPAEEPVAEEAKEEPVVAEEAKEEPKEEAKPRRKGILLVRGYDKYGPRGVLVERRDFDYPREPIQQKSLTAEEVREILRDELERQENAKLAAQYKAEKQAQAIADAVAKAKEEKKVEEPVVEEAGDEEVVATPIVFAAPEVVKEENKEVKKEAKKAEGLTEEQVKNIIAEEIKNALKDFVVTVQKEVRVVEEVHEVSPAPEVKEEPVAEEAPVAEPEKVVEAHEEETPAPEVEVAPVEVAPVANDEVVVVEASEPAAAEEEPKEKIVRIPFATRIQEAEPAVKDAFNHLKSLLKSYNLNDRVSIGGDSFRLHRVTYCKIAMAGKGLKLYLALNPEDYANTTLPIKDASSKAAYKETPLVFKVKSGLSVRRAEDLIRDCMDKHGIEQADKVLDFDWVSEIANAEVEDDDMGDDEE